MRWSPRLRVKQHVLQLVSSEDIVGVTELAVYLYRFTGLKKSGNLFFAEAEYGLMIALLAAVAVP